MTTNRHSRGLFTRWTGKTLNRVTFRSNQYKQVLQKKIDLGALQKRIEQLHCELGTAVARQYELGQKDLLSNKEIALSLERVAHLQQAARLLEEEIEQIRSELPTIPGK